MQPIASQIADSQWSLSDSSSADQLANMTQGGDDLQHALNVREAFTSFVGETFFHQMIKAMRTSVGKPAYFHGGQAEEIFRGQLDQALTETMTAASASKFSKPLFDRQFPRLAKIIDENENKNASQTNSPETLNDLATLVRR